MAKLENASMMNLWNQILNRFNATAQYLHKVDVDLISANAMLLLLVDYVPNLCNEFLKFETEPKALCTSITHKYSDSSKRRIAHRLRNLHGYKKKSIRIQQFMLML